MKQITVAEWIIKNEPFIKQGIKAGIITPEKLTHARIWQEFKAMTNVPTKEQRYWLIAEKYGYRDESSVRALIKRMNQKMEVE